MAENSKDVIMFDGVCNMCNGFVQFILKHESKPHFYFSSLQSDISISKLQAMGYAIDLENLKSVLLISNGEVHDKSTAAIEILRKLNRWGRIAVILYVFPKFLRDFVYDWIARNRYKWFGKQEVCWMQDPKWKPRFL